ncbi:ATP-binding protein [Dendronalium sp. ChiSLP03b]|uniref:ATP-binding protein n=1 Tax=Dendronalium sp. ChiSLP03b TaxID=3075381 RepID=UPI002AD26B8A|nr:ATP-binding protein [Dendronalium sp. ChiSLP03b]MDZ8204970.1 ATP-binding protein [Dendronalium sp. ChiSLP03b]
MLSKLQPVKFLNRLIGKLYAQMPIRLVSLVHFVLQISGAIGLVGYLSFQGHKAVKKLATHLENEICDRIEQHLDRYLTILKLIKHILKLNTPARKIATGEGKQSTELGELANSFNSMVKELQESFAALEAKQAEMKTLDNELSKITFALMRIASQNSKSSSLPSDIATFSDTTQNKQEEHNCVVEAQVKERTQELLLVIERLQIAQQELIQAHKIATQGQQAAEQANRAKSEFLANMSHELRTPLNAILGFTQIMSQDNSLSNEHQQNLAIINRAGEHLLNLINDILEMSKIEAGRTTLNVSSFDLISFLQSLEEMLRCRTVSKEIQLIFDYTPDIPRYVQTDESRLRQVLLNLLGNAIKFTRTGSVTLRVRLGTGDCKGAEEKKAILSNCPQFLSLPSPLPLVSQSLIFEVQDTGAGISPQEIDLLFEAFGQTEIGRKSQQGTGLGLAISRKYVQLMGGDITVSSALGVGSKFTFNIEIDVAESSEIPSKQTQCQVISLAPEQKEYRILVVDDVADNRLLLVKLLTPIGFVVREAANGQEAIAQWMEWQPHLIFMDMRMPVMDGYEATRIIKAREIEHGVWGVSYPQQVITNDINYCPFYDYKSAPPNVLALSCPIPHTNTVIIALTASAFEEERQQILSTGCDDFIRKPFTQEILLQTVSQYLGVKYISKVETTNTVTVNQETQIIASKTDILRDLSQMSPEWLGRVRHAAASCSDDLILELIQHIPPDKSQIFRVLKDLANNYQFEKIMELTRTDAE